MEDLICLLLLSPLCLCCSARPAASHPSARRCERQREREHLRGGEGFGQPLRGCPGGVGEQGADSPPAICELLTSHLATLTRQLLLWSGGRRAVIYLYPDFPEDAGWTNLALLSAHWGICTAVSSKRSSGGSEHEDIKVDSLMRNLIHFFLSIYTLTQRRWQILERHFRTC